MPTSSSPQEPRDKNLAVRYTGQKPPATLRVWCDAHADRVREVEVGFGYCSDREDGKAYDILLRPGWRMRDDFVHTIIEPTVRRALDQLRNIARCECEECVQQHRFANGNTQHTG